MSVAPSCGIRVVDTVFVGGILFCVFEAASAMFIVNLICGWMDRWTDIEASHRFYKARYICIYRIQKEPGNSVGI